ncbi:fusion protein [Rhizobium oryzihabitans]|uniref:fusion protein n=1 Tax=Rhizobium oryzihabitans TaxID=2267833 RepID=UPI001FE5CF91|nr:fusion protein [Rhizobium oryzihabitans]
MANTTWYGDGTATVAVGSRTVTGTDTGWLTEVAGLTPIKVGDKFGIHVGRPIVIEQIISDTELLLADDWPGPAQTDAPYKIELTSPTIAAVEAMRRLLASLSNGNLDSLSEISVGTDDIPIGIGPGVFGTVKKSELKDGVQFDEAVADLAGRAAYDTAAADFRVLVADIGDGRSAVYIKESATSGDWSVPYYITGTVGPAGVNQRGNYSAGTTYAIRDIVQYEGSTWIAKVETTGNAPPTLPTTENTQWLLFARSGTPGVVDRGAYSGATAYATNDIVLNSGSTWIALQPTTGNAPPVLPAESNAYWRLLARKGTDGTGTGDVVGPAGGVAVNDLAVFADATGKLLKKAPNNVVGNALLSQLAAPAIKGRLTAGTGNVEDLTPAQANQLLGGWEPIGSLDLTGQTSGIVNNLSAFRIIKISSDFSLSGTDYAIVQVSTDNGSTFLTSTADYTYKVSDVGSSGTVSGGVGSFAGILLGNGQAGSTASLFGFNKSRRARAVVLQSFRTGDDTLRTLSSELPGTTARNAIRIVSAASLFAYGSFFFEGIRG